MSREQSYLSIILKKQPYGEGDELVTVFTREAGKIRALAKSSKLAKSKLAYGLQVLFLTNLRLAGSHLPKIIGTDTRQAFPRIRENLDAAKAAFYVLELVLKATADEQKNEELFDLLADFLVFLDGPKEQGALAAGLIKFKIKFLEAVGFSVHAEVPEDFSGQLAFSSSRGGFLVNATAADARAINISIYRLYQSLGQAAFADLAAAGAGGDVPVLQELLSDFIEFHLERDIKSERFFSL